MSDYRINVKVRNARILNAIEKTGHRPGQPFATLIGIGYHALLEYINCTRVPFDEDGNLRSCAEKLCIFFNKLPNDLWSSLKFYRDYIFGNPDDYIKERFDSLEKALNKAAMGLQDRKTASKPQFVEYDSGTMLGLSKVIVRLPQKSTYSKSDIDTMIAAHRYFYMWVDRRPKINLGSLFEGNVKLMVTKSDVEKILDESEKLIVHANELLSFSNQLSHAGAAMSISLPEMINRRESSDIYDPTSIVKGTQIFARICSVIFDSSSSGYNFSLGNIKNALTIAEKAIGKM